MKVYGCFKSWWKAYSTDELPRNPTYRISLSYDPFGIYRILPILGFCICVLFMYVVWGGTGTFPWWVPVLFSPLLIVSFFPPKYIVQIVGNSLTVALKNTSSFFPRIVAITIPFSEIIRLDFAVEPDSHIKCMSWHTTFVRLLHNYRYVFILVKRNGEQRYLKICADYELIRMVEDRLLAEYIPVDHT